MSVQPMSNPQQGKEYTWSDLDYTGAPPPQDVIVIFGGYGGTGLCQEGIANKNSVDAHEVLLSQIPTLKSINDNMRIKGWNGGKLLLQRPAFRTKMGGCVPEGMAFVQANFHHRGKLIIYGNSAGGVDALHLCQLIQESYPYYGFAGGNNPPPQPHLGAVVSRDKPYGRVRVDLLITVDAGAGKAEVPIRGGFTKELGLAVPSCVKYNLNIFRTAKSEEKKDGSGSTYGGENEADDYSMTTIKDFDLGNTPHFTEDGRGMGMVSLRDVVMAIQSTLLYRDPGEGFRDATNALIASGAAMGLRYALNRLFRGR